MAGGDEQSTAVIAALVQRLGISTRIAVTGAEAISAAREQVPALVILELELEDPSAYEVCRALRERFGEGLPIALVSANRTEPHDEIAALLLGADDYFIAPLDEERFVARLRRLLARSPVGGGRSSSLTRREEQVLGLLVDGRRPIEIAKLLFITPKTAATHIDHILAKLGAHSQAQAVAFAVRDKLLANVS